MALLQRARNVDLDKIIKPDHRLTHIVTIQSAIFQFHSVCSARLMMPDCRGIFGSVRI